MADERAEAPNAPAPARPVPGPDWLTIALLVFFLALIGLVAALLVLPAIQG
jgi:hypothetical protein